MVNMGRVMPVIAATLGLAQFMALPDRSYDFYPNIADVRHASPATVKFFREFFTIKSADSPSVIDYYNAHEAQYSDSTLGITIGANRSELTKNLQSIEVKWAKSASHDRSYPLRILGDIEHGAIVYFVDTPGLFGAEIRTLSTFDFSDGLISRQVDNWDGRGNRVKSSPTGNETYPDLGLNALQEKADPVMKAVSVRLNNALSAGDYTTASKLFSYDAVFEDLTLRTRIEGQISISSYLERVLHLLPYGPGTELVHVLGSKYGGGYEWRPKGHGVRYGVTALVLNERNEITQLTTIWDGSRVDQSFIEAVVKLGVSKSV